MPLDRYRAKRDFTHTPEPEGAAAEESQGDAPERPDAGGDAGHSFVVQKHAATRLHYDFRLEIGGVLASWAVPKGPSLDPHDKRLAVHVEDHPLEYGGFEGTIPAGEYGGGTVMLWDRGTYVPELDMAEGLARGDLKFTLLGEKLHGSWALVRMKPRPGEKAENWLLIKHRDEHARPHEEYDLTAEETLSAATGRTMEQIASAGAAADDGAPDADASVSAAPPARAATRVPADAPMQLATLVSEPPTGEGWIHEIKYDGYRVRIAVEDGRAKVMTRTGADWTDRFEPLADAAIALPVASALLDGEVVAVRPDGISDFGLLQQALAEGHPEHLVYQAFDLLHLNGHDLRGEPLLARKDLLRELVGLAAPGSPLRFTEHVIAEGPAFHGQACEATLEGTVSKRADRPYVAGRTPDWRKTKCLLRQEFVVLGWTEPGGSREGFGALLLGGQEGGDLRYAGRVGTGFTGSDLASLSARLRSIETDGAPVEVPASVARLPLHWVRPELVVEVAFREWTRDGVIRQPSFKGVREDKPAEDVRIERAGAPEEDADPGDPPAPGGGAATGPVVIAGITISNPDKVLYPTGTDPAVGVTKSGLARYYESIAPHILPHLVGRPLTLVRCPHGHARDCFYQKHPDNRGFPAALRTFEIDERSGRQTYFYIEDAPGLISLVQLGALELHVWNSLVAEPELPDRIVFDLDPGPDVDWNQVCDAARTVGAALGALGLTAFVKTTGGRGLHVVTPIEADREHDAVRGFAHALVDRIASADPARFTSRMAKDLRPGRVFVDYLRNSHGATAVAAFSTRARAGAPVSVPVAWNELVETLDPASLDTVSVPARVNAAGYEDPWAGYDDARTALTDAMLAAVGAGAGNDQDS